MRKTILLSILTACGLAVSAPQAINDAPGVTVSLGGATVLHRTPVAYPVTARNAGVQGNVSVELKLNSEGEVADAQVVGGPEELRKPVLESVLQWHFSADVAGTTHLVRIAFELPKGATTVAPNPPAPAAVQEGVIHSIRVTGLTPEASAQLTASLPVHEGDLYSADSALRTSQAVKTFDEHLGVRTSTATAASGSPQLDVTISPDQRIMVGGGVISASIVRKVPPVYPADAKAARIQGVVHMSAIIGMDGSVQQLAVLSGPQELVQSALDAVKQWVYRPTMLNGNPVQVETTVDVNYTLSQ